MKLLSRIIVSLVLVALIVNQIIHNIVVELYSPDWVSSSISEARNRGVFISQPSLKKNTISWKDSEYFIDEVWIEKAFCIKYELIFIQRFIPMGYRLMLRINPKENPSGKDFPFVLIGGENRLKCNNFIEIDRQTGDVLYAEVTSPLPSSIQCSIETKMPNS